MRSEHRTPTWGCAACLAAYVAIGLALQTPSISDWMEGHPNLSKIAIAPLFFIGLVMQIIPYCWLQERMEGSKNDWIRNRADWSIGIWLLFLLGWTVWASPG